MLLQLKKIANRISDSRKMYPEDSQIPDRTTRYIEKTSWLLWWSTAAPIALTVVIGIKIEEILEDTQEILKGKKYESVTSRSLKRISHWHL